MSLTDSGFGYVRYDGGLNVSVLLEKIARVFMFPSE